MLSTSLNSVRTLQFYLCSLSVHSLEDIICCRPDYHLEAFLTIMLRAVLLNHTSSGLPSDLTLRLNNSLSACVPKTSLQLPPRGLSHTSCGECRHQSGRFTAPWLLIGTQMTKVKEPCVAQFNIKVLLNNSLLWLMFQYRIRLMVETVTETGFMH